MKRIIYVLSIVFLTSICIYGFTFIPSLCTYTITESDYEKVYTQLQTTLKPISEQGILMDDDIRAMITIDDFKNKTAKEKIEIQVSDYLKQALKKQKYQLHDEQIKTIVSSIAIIYEQYTPSITNSAILDKTRNYTLSASAISGISILLCMIVLKKRYSKIPS